jgi:hypothetical protein
VENLTHGHVANWVQKACQTPVAFGLFDELSIDLNFGRLVLSGNEHNKTTPAHFAQYIIPDDTPVRAFI